MPLNAGEKAEAAVALLRCWGEDINGMGRTLAFLSKFTVGKVDLLAEVKTAAQTWQPFIDGGTDIVGYNQEIERVYDQFIAGG